MSFEVRIEQDSINPDGVRLTTFVLKYPRWIHSEIMTHRMLSRSASSSRAIPVEKQIQAVLDDPALPVVWGRNQKGMQASRTLTPEEQRAAETLWLSARDAAVEQARHLVALGVHKQLVNRILEPYSHISVIVSATEWENFFTLRTHPTAQPEFQFLANLMAAEFRQSKPVERYWGEYHLPFIRPEERLAFNNGELRTMSTARCARISYANHDGTDPVAEKDYALHDQLVVAEPLHASPAEFPAMAFKPGCQDKNGYFVTVLSGSANNYDFGNFRPGWMQYRKMLKRECASTFPWDEVKETTVVFDG